ncbi:hypothetical protein GG344DRAFT_68504 [Lentinula edodes]|nr:hypothetical protein GG344DRAFT_68504 [Lentinula edodes]
MTISRPDDAFVHGGKTIVERTWTELMEGAEKKKSERNELEENAGEGKGYGLGNEWYYNGRLYFATKKKYSDYPAIVLLLSTNRKHYPEICYVRPRAFAGSTRRYVLYLIITVLCLSYGYSIILKPILYAAYNLLWWIFKVPVWALYGLRWISWQIIRGIRALAWFGFYVHFCGYAMKESLDMDERCANRIEGPGREMLPNATRSRLGINTTSAEVELKEDEFFHVCKFVEEAGDSGPMMQTDREKD